MSGTKRPSVYEGRAGIWGLVEQRSGQNTEHSSCVFQWWLWVWGVLFALPSLAMLMGCPPKLLLAGGPAHSPA